MQEAPVLFEAVLLLPTAAAPLDEASLTPTPVPTAVSNENILAPTAPPASRKTHEVAAGETLSGIGETFGASDYPYELEFVGALEVTGDAGEALALHDIANFTVEMTTHQALDFEKNRDGLQALLHYLDRNEEGSG